VRKVTEIEPIWNDDVSAGKDDRFGPLRLVGKGRRRRRKFGILQSLESVARLCGRPLERSSLVLLRLRLLWKGTREFVGGGGEQF
jgi:hypothetical protein